MNSEVRRATRSAGPGWLATAGGALLLIALGFGVGIVAGTAYQEPDLVVDHLAGRSTEVVLDAPAAIGEAPLASAPDVAAAAPPALPGPALGAGALGGARGSPRADGEPSARAALPAPEVPASATATAAAAVEAPAAPVKVPAVSGRAPAAPAKAPAAPARAPARAGGFSIQVGAFSSEKAARELATELGRHGYTAYLMDEGTGARWKVRVGPLRSRTEAESLSARLKREQHLPTWIQANG